MNIFYTDHDPAVAAQSLPDKHIVKMPVETVQMLVSALVRWDLQPNVATKAGTIHKGGYHKHPSTVWAGDNRENAWWLLRHGFALCAEYTKRYGKVHFAEGQLRTILDSKLIGELPLGPLTPPAQAMPDEFKHADPVMAYRACIRGKVASKPDSFVWRKGTPAPSWL
jgi:hypothetical protein